MAAVYVGRRDDGEIVAIKRIRDEYARSKDFLTMLLDEARIVSRLRHPNIVRYHEFGRGPSGDAFIVMELLFGQSLWAVWEACRARATRLDFETIAWIGARVADGLHYAHELVGEDGRSSEIVHRDVNATNIFVTYEGSIKIIDFGLAKATNRASKTAAGVIKGKVAYMSPEQAVGAPIDRRTDVFALGTTLWELSCDRRLFKRGDEIETLRRVHAAEVPDPTKLVEGYPPALWGVLQRALARDKERRYPTAAAFAQALDAFASQSPYATGSRVVSSRMHELFGPDRERQAEWVADASTPEQRDGQARAELKPVPWGGFAHPLKARSTFNPGDGDPRASASFVESALTLTDSAVQSVANSAELPQVSRRVGSFRFAVLAIGVVLATAALLAVAMR
jgi:serine/threonine protein kinase